MTPRAPASRERESLGLPAPVLGVLMGVAAVIAAWPLAHPYLNPDAYSFEALARSLLAGHGLHYREPMLPWVDLFAFRSPGYPVFLAPWLALGGVRLALAVNGAMLAWTASQAGEIASRATSRRAGRIAFALVLVWPMAWVAAGELMSETLFVALSATALRVALDAMGSRRIAAGLLAGLLAAACLLTRPVGIAVLGAIALGLVVRAPRAAFACVAVAALAYAPWPLRNQRVLGAPVLFTTNAGFNLYDGVSPAYTDSLWREMAGWRPLGERAMDDRWRARYRAVLKADPGAQVRRSAVQMARFLVPVEREPVQWLHRAVVWLALAGLLLAGVSPATAMLAVAWLGQGAINSLAQVHDRYRFPSEWLVAVFAALAVDALLRRPGGVRGRLAIAALVAVSVLLFVLQLARHAG